MPDAFDISGKVTIVTGGGTGIGADIASVFCQRGAKVLVTSRTMDHLGPVADGIRNAGGTIESAVCDVRQNDQVEAVVKKAVDLWGRVDVLIIMLERVLLPTRMRFPPMGSQPLSRSI